MHINTVYYSGIAELDKYCPLTAGRLTDIVSPRNVDVSEFLLYTYVYNALTTPKANVLFITMRLSSAQVTNLLVARHLHKISGEPMESLIDPIYRNLATKEQWEEAKFDLLDSGKYGKFCCMSGSLYANDLEAALDVRSAKYGQFHMIVIDNMLHIDWKGSVGDSVVAQGYAYLKQFIVKQQIVGISAIPFNNKGHELAQISTEVHTDMITGGLSVHRYPDQRIALFPVKDSSKPRVLKVIKSNAYPCKSDGITFTYNDRKEA